jgi:hypothetical protein
MWFRGGGYGPTVRRVDGHSILDRMGYLKKAELPFRRKTWARWCRPVKQARLNRGQERGRASLGHGPAPPAPRRTGQQQMRPGPGHADKQQSPFFGQIGACPAARSGGRLAASSGACLTASSGIRSGKPERQQASLAASHEHHRELQAFGGMQRQQGDRIGAGVEGVRLRPERDLSEEGRQVVAAATG